MICRPFGAFPEALVRGTPDDRHPYRDLSSLSSSSLQPGLTLPAVPLIWGGSVKLGLGCVEARM